MERKARSIREFMHAEKIKQCIVCTKLTPDMVEQIRAAMKGANVRLDVILAWLKMEHGIVLTPAQWSTHANGRHRVVGA